jgi:hypothetical protein
MLALPAVRTEQLARFTADALQIALSGRAVTPVGGVRGA